MKIKHLTLTVTIVNASLLKALLVCLIVLKKHLTDPLRKAVELFILEFVYI